MLRPFSGTKLGQSEFSFACFDELAGDVGFVAGDFPGEQSQSGVALPGIVQVGEFYLSEGAEDIGFIGFFFDCGSHRRELGVCCGVCVCGKS